MMKRKGGTLLIKAICEGRMRRHSGIKNALPCAGFAHGAAPNLDVTEADPCMHKLPAAAPLRWRDSALR